MFAEGRDDCVHMIRHHDFVQQLITLPLKVPQSPTPTTRVFPAAPARKRRVLDRASIETAQESVPNIRGVAFPNAAQDFCATIRFAPVTIVAVFPAAANLPSET